MNNNLEFENEDPDPDNIEDNHPRTNYGEGFNKTIKTSWNRDEVINLFNRFTEFISHNEPDTWNNWIEQNL